MLKTITTTGGHFTISADSLNTAELKSLVRKAKKHTDYTEGTRHPHHQFIGTTKAGKTWSVTVML